MFCLIRCSLKLFGSINKISQQGLLKRHPKDQHAVDLKLIFFTTNLDSQNKVHIECYLFFLLWLIVFFLLKCSLAWVIIDPFFMKEVVGKL